jgi:hypothetical protein
VRFAPTAVGEALDTYNLVSDAPGSPHTIALSSVAYNPVSLNKEGLPAAFINTDYVPFEFGRLLDVSNELSPDRSKATWDAPLGLPEGMQLDRTTGTLSGKPTALTSGEGASFEVVSTYKQNSGQQLYTLKVGELVLRVTDIVVGRSFTCALTASGGSSAGEITTTDSWVTGRTRKVLPPLTC